MRPIVHIRPVLALLLSAAVLPAHAAFVITEVAPWSSGNSSVAADWFELTNTGPSAVNITGFKMDDNSNSFSLSVPMSGITTIAAGESIIFIETSSATTVNTFKTVWFGASPPPGLQIGMYSGSGVGLNTGGDAVNVYNASGVLQANVSFGASPGASPFATFDNAAMLNNTTISTLSVPGTNGAFSVVDGANGTLIGSPGTIGAVPEPGSIGLVGLGAAALLGFAARRRSPRAEG
jgi:hypothetical protein